MFTQAEQWMIPALSELWQACFGDDDEYIAFFMAHRFRPEDTFVWLEEGKPVGAAYLIPCQLDGKLGRYGYAGGVLPQWRNRGIFEKLFHGLWSFCLQEGSYFFFAPRPGTEGYYRRFGFSDAFCYETVRHAPCGPGGPLVVAEASPEAYTALRDAALQGAGYVRWDIPSVTYALSEHRLSGGFAHILTWAGQEYLLFGSCSQDGLYLRETTLPPALLSELVSSLCLHYQVPCVTCEFPTQPKPGSRYRGLFMGTVPFSAGWLGLDLT